MKKIIIFALYLTLHNAVKASVPYSPAFPTPGHLKVPTYQGHIPVMAEDAAASLKVERAFAELPKTGPVTVDMEQQFQRHLIAAHRLIKILEKRGQLGHFAPGEKDQISEAVAYQLAILKVKNPNFTPIDEQKRLNEKVTTLSDFTVDNERAWNLAIASDDSDDEGFAFVPSQRRHLACSLPFENFQ